MKRKWDQQLLLHLPETSRSEREIGRLLSPVWTKNKARLVEPYLYLFVQITKHGTYLDAFAGPQNPDDPGMWAAKLVLASEPRFLKHFYLFDSGRRQIGALRDLKKSQPPDSQRTIEIYPGDVNVQMIKLLRSGKIKREKEAVFCLLDQRTFECHWSTVRALAEYKVGGQYKIELFYFLANSWLDRALAAQKKTEVPEEWWGRVDWPKLRAMNQDQRVGAFVDRFRNDLGYLSVSPYPIFQREAGGGSVMYYMIHATDYPGAPPLMVRAYNESVRPRQETAIQLSLTLNS